MERLSNDNLTENRTEILQKVPLLFYYVMKIQPPISMLSSKVKLTIVALNQQISSIKDLPHQCRASTTMFARIFTQEPYGSGL